MLASFFCAMKRAVCENPQSGVTLTLSWSALATGFTLHSSATLGAGSIWAPVAGAPNPITGAGSINVPASGAIQVYRLQKP